MFDNLREQANSTPFYEDEAQFREAEGMSTPIPRQSSRRSFLGMTPMQRFFLSAMLFIMVCLVGVMFLLMTGTISLF